MSDADMTTRKTRADILPLRTEATPLAPRNAALINGASTAAQKPRRSWSTYVAQYFLMACMLYLLWQTFSVDADAPDTTPDFSYLAEHCAHIPPIPARSFVQHQDTLAQTLHALGASAYIAEPGASAAYFANISGSHWHLSERPLLLIIRPAKDEHGDVRANISILTPAFEETRAKLLPVPNDAGITYVAWPEDQSPFSRALSLLPDADGAQVFVDGSVRTFITDGLQKAAPNARVTIAPVEIRRLRERKSFEEIEILKCVNEVTVLAIRAARDYMRIGMRESEAGQLINSALTAAGLKDAFALTLFGENAALPHGSGTNRVLGRHDFVLIDCGGTLHGYHSDVTRTFALPQTEVPRSHFPVWRMVHKAQHRALAAAKNGTVAAAIDRAARSVITKAGYGEYFTHRLGHGIGLETHESPYLVGGSEDILLTGHTFSDEPGIYIEGKVGVRLEDCFYINEDGDGRYLTAGVGGPAASPWDP